MRPGSLTGFLLQGMRCSCAPSGDKDGDVLHTRFKPQDKFLTRKRVVLETMRRTVSAALSQSDAAMVELQTGDLIGGVYELGELVGKGGMGLIYRARHNTLGRVVALKFISPSMVSPETWSLFKNEVKISSSLLDTAICQIYDLGLHHGVLPYYAMDFVDGSSLEEVVLRQGPLSIGSTLEIYAKVAEGLSYAHSRSIVHKDIKPANIMIAENEPGMGVKILDFGIAELNEGRKQSLASNPINDLQEKEAAIIGSAAYMSPEQAQGQPLDQRSDIYSLGCSMFETLTGVPPFQDESFQKMVESHINQPAPLLSDITGSAVPLPLEAVIRKCLRKKQRARYQSAADLITDLNSLLNRQDLVHAKGEQLELARAAREEAEEREESKRRRKALVVPTVVLLSLICLLGGTFAAFKFAGNFDTTSQTNTFYQGQRTDPSGTVFNIYQFPPVSAEFPRGLGRLEAYPKGLPLEELSVVPANPTKSVHVTHYDCVGKVEVDSRLQLTYVADSQLGTHKELLNKFRSLDLDGINFVGVTKGGPALYLLAAGHFPHLHRIIVGKLAEERKVQTALEKFSNVVDVGLNEWDFATNNKNYSPFAKNRLRTLGFTPIGGGMKMIVNAGSPENSPQRIFNKDMLFDKVDEDILIALPRLTYLGFSHCQFVKTDVSLLFASPSLETLYVEGSEMLFDKIDPTNVPTLNKLNQIRVKCSRDMPPDQKQKGLAYLEALKSRNPGLQVIVE